MKHYLKIVITLGPLLASFACDNSAPETAESSPPGSIPDTSSHVAAPAIPEYGPPPEVGEVRAHLAQGQVLYVPVYSHIFHRREDEVFQLTTTLSIRNTSPTTSVEIEAVDYFNSEGALLTSYLRRPRRLAPLASTIVVIAEQDRSGGVGANFIVTWRSAEPVHLPVVEAVMIGTRLGQGVSFTSPGRILLEW